MRRRPADVSWFPPIDFARRCFATVIAGRIQGRAFGRKGQWADGSALNADRSALNADRSALNADRSALNADRSALNADRSALDNDREQLI
jgi:hypothetical protein